LKTLVLISSCGFPLSALAGSILTGKLPEKFDANKIWEAIPAGKKSYSEGRLCRLGESPAGDSVAAFTARSGRVILKNMVQSFLEIHNINMGRCRIVEINTRPSLIFLIGQELLGIPLAGRAGRKMVEKYIEKIYPQLAGAVKLDCACQISDN